jgi:hypothetical protein
LDIAPRSIARPRGKSEDAYIGLPYGDVHFPRLARNHKENRQGVIAQGHAKPTWSLAKSGNYRTYHPKYLFFIKEVEGSNGSKRLHFERRAVNQV